MTREIIHLHSKQIKMPRQCVCCNSTNELKEWNVKEKNNKDLSLRFPLCVECTDSSMFYKAKKVYKKAPKKNNKVGIVLPIIIFLGYLLFFRNDFGIAEIVSFIIAVGCLVALIFISLYFRKGKPQPKAIQTMVKLVKNDDDFYYADLVLKNGIILTVIKNKMVIINAKIRINLH